MNTQTQRHLTHNFLAALTCGIILLSLSTPPVSAEDAAELLKLSGIKGGLVVHLGCADGELTNELHAGEQYFVHGLDTDEENVAAGRANIIEKGIYGPVSIDKWDGKLLPYADNLVNLIVAEDAKDVSKDELLRVVAPNGVALIRREGKWEKIVKPWPKEIDEWTHYLHDADGNPVANDTVVGPPERLQWIGSPQWSRHHDHMASLTSLVSASGRLFYILDEGPRASIQLPPEWRLIARDAFNGVVLWKRNIGQWNTHQYPLKSGPAHLLRRLVAVGDRVYVTLGIDAPVTALDAATGKTVLTYEDSAYTREIIISDGAAFFVADTSRCLLPDWRRKHTYVWANTSEANPGWGWEGSPRKILAYEADSGRPLWQAEAPVAPCSLAADNKRIVFHDGEKLVCIDRANGQELWQGEKTPTAIPVPTNTGPRVLIYKDVVLLAPNTGKMSGWDANNGKKLWEQPQRPSGHASLKDLFVIEGLVWTGSIANSGDDGAFAGYDPATGILAKEFPADVQVHWFHHRCYPSKAAGKYILTGRNGTEYIDLEAEHWKPNHWLRGGCIYGVMPCNGMTYAPMDSCGCQLEAKLTGLKALAPRPLPKISQAALSAEARLEKGPAYQVAEGPSASPADWPTYRHDAARSGAAPANVSAGLNQVWQTRLTAPLTAPTIAGGKLFVASKDIHTIHALNTQTGRQLWSYTTGGRVDSPPTYYKGLALLGSADGYVYALRAEDGSLAWRFRAAPIDRRMMAWEQLESAWPVHGSILVYNDVLYCTAGRNMYIDGGIRLIRLHPRTGNLLGETVMDDKDPDTGEDMHTAYLKKTQGNNMPVAHSDILSCDGRNLWLRSQKITLDGKRIEIALQDVTEQNPEDFHIFCQNGFLDDSYFFRSYWTYGRRVTGGYGGWFRAGRLVPSGRILCFDDARVYGYGRKPQYMLNASVVEYQVFAAEKVVTPAAIEKVGATDRAINARSAYSNASSSDWRVLHFFPPEDLSAAKLLWKLDQPTLIARAMTVTEDTLFIAGPPDLLDERQAYHNPDDPDVQARLKRQAEALEGRLGGQLWAFNKADGKLAARYALDTIPVFDGMAAAGDSLYMTTINGSVIRFSGTGGAVLNQVGDVPTQIIWPQPEDPNYLLPPEEPKEADFAKVTRCKVVASNLGYRLRATGKNQVGIALKKLDKPITGSATFKTSIKAAPAGDGLLSNGFLAFGDKPNDAALIKCGIKLRAESVSIIQGPLLSGNAKTAKIKPPGGKTLEITVTVNLEAGKIVCTADGVTVQADIQTPLKSITHVGYAIDSAVIDVAPIEIATP